MTSLLCGNLAVVLNVDVLVGGERVDRVVRERGTGLGQFYVQMGYCQGHSLVVGRLT